MQAGGGIEFVDLPCAVTCGCGVEMPAGGQAVFDPDRGQVYCLWCLADHQAGRPIPHERRPHTPAPLPPPRLDPAPPELAPASSTASVTPTAPTLSTVPMAPLPSRSPRGGGVALAAILVAAILGVSAFALRSALEPTPAVVPAAAPSTSAPPAVAAAQALQGDVQVGHETPTSSAREKWPPVPADAQSTPIGMPPQRPSGSTDYAFLKVLHDTYGQPVRWDPCRPIHLVVNAAEAPAGGDSLIRQAVAEVSADTGLSFTIEGTTRERPTNTRGARNVALYGNRWAPVLVAWTDPATIPVLAGDIVGLGGGAEASYADAEDRHYVSGIVYLDAPDFARILKNPKGGRAMAEAIVLHEFGHLVGLAHVDVRSELMYPRLIDQTGFGPGDLDGLAQLGGGPCFSR